MGESQKEERGAVWQSSVTGKRTGWGARVRVLRGKKEPRTLEDSAHFKMNPNSIKLKQEIKNPMNKSE